MKLPHPSSWLVTLTAVAVFAVLWYFVGHPGISQAQDADKSLDIERYPNEPLEFVDLKIGQNSVKKDINFKFRDKRSQAGKDNVRFKDKENWFKKVQVRLRNTSGRPIYSLRVSIYFIVNSSSLRMAFDLPLKAMETRDLQQKPLQPGEELDLAVTENSFNDAMATTRRYDVDANQVQPVLSVDAVSFDDDLMWRKGTLMRRDPNNPKRWRRVDSPPLGASRSKPAGFNPATNSYPGDET